MMFPAGILRPHGRLGALVLLALVAVAPPRAAARDLTTYVNPFIGTAPAPSAHYGQEFDGGDVFPGAVYPAGMLAWSPDTLEHRLPGGYAYADRALRGFSLTHFSGRGCTAYQDVPVLPIVGAPSASPLADPTVARATFSHVRESAAPGVYHVDLDSGVHVDLTATPRTGFGQVTFPPTDQATILVDAGGSINGTFASSVDIDPDRQVLTGMTQSQVGCGLERYTLYFAIAFDRPFATYGTWREAQLNPGALHADAPHSGAYLTFETSTTAVVRLKPAISYVSIANALANLSDENPGWHFETVAAAARDAWNATLSSIVVDGGSRDDLTTFYTALYHAFLQPNLFSDSNGQYLGFDDQVHHVPAGHAHYHNVAAWDQYRSLVQLRTVLAPDQMNDIVQSLIDDAQQGGGGMPRWEQANRNSAGMVGDSPGPFVASAYAFGARAFDAAAALAALADGASDPTAESGGHPVREYLEPWLTLGYVPDQPSITLEYATDDFAIAQLARAMGDTALSDRLLGRAAQWTNTFNPTTGYVEPRDGAGRFAPVDHATGCCGFVEGNAAQYTWMVPFDSAGLIDRLGGEPAAVARLDELFADLNAGPDRPNAWMGNEPSLATPWAYDFAGAPAATQAVVRRMQRELFNASPAGLPGNDDGGALSAWYVFSTIGLYPAVPGVGGLATGSPLFEDATLRLANGASLHIVGRGAGPDAPYVQTLRVDGVLAEGTWLDWSRLARGATLEFALNRIPTGTQPPR